MNSNRSYYINQIKDLSTNFDDDTASKIISEMKENLGKILNVDPSSVGMKATTHENIGSLGRAEGIAAHAVCLVTRFSD